MLGAAQASQAAIIDWTLSNGTFDDGGTFSGNFRFNSATDTITQWSVNTSFGNGDSNTYSSSSGCFIVLCPSATDNGSGPSFAFSFFIVGAFFNLTNVPLATPGSVAPLSGDESFFNPFSGAMESHTVTGGTALGVLSASVPEPAEWALTIAGAGLAGAALRRSRRTVVAA